MQEQKPATYRDKLVQDRQTVKDRNKLLNGVELLLLVGMFAAGEKYDIAFSRIICFLFLLWICKDYKSQDSTADNVLIFHDAEVKMRTAAQSNDVELLKKCLLVLGKNKIDASGSKTGKTALHFAVAAMSLATTNFLVKIKANVNLQDAAQGETPVHCAVQNIIKNASTPMEEQAYRVLFALITVDQGIQPGFLIGQSRPPVINKAVLPYVRNTKGETVMDLLNKIPNKMSKDFKKAAAVYDVLIKERNERLLGHLNEAKVIETKVSP